MVNLETRLLKDVPVGGVFITWCAPISNGNIYLPMYDIMVCLRHSLDDVMVSWIDNVVDGDIGIDTLYQDEEVVYTGVRLPINKLPIGERLRGVYGES